MYDGETVDHQVVTYHYRGAPDMYEDRRIWGRRSDDGQEGDVSEL